MGYTEITGCGIRQHVLNRNKNTGKEEVFTQEDQTFTGRKTFLSGITTSDLDARTVEVAQSLTVDGYDISQIKNYLPNDVSAENKLTTESFVNSSVATNTAYFRGTFNSVEELEAYSGEKTNNDYAFVIISEDAEGNTVYKRYKYNAENEEWVFEYSLNNSSFTSDQWEAINSGITEELVEQIGAGVVISPDTGNILELKTNGLYAKNNIDDSQTTTGNTWSADKLNKRSTYSTDEKVVGTWIDGKNIYRKVIQVQVSAVDDFRNIALNISYDNIIRYHITLKDSGNNIFVLPFEAISVGGINYIFGFFQNGNFRFFNKVAGTLTLTLEYTKTTY